MAAIYMKTEEIPELILDEKPIETDESSELCIISSVCRTILTVVISMILGVIISALLFFNDDKISRNFTIFVLCGALFLYILSVINESFWNVTPIREGTHIAIMRTVA